ncbi:MAG: sel1 repeat family protein [Ruminococcaceae bacterium]|nr:sel1 repeat family protein [Oscillospiraceae bacterium]
MNCKQCNAQVKVDDLTCNSCGASIPQPEIKETGPILENTTLQDKQEAAAWLKKGLSLHKSQAYAEAVPAYEQAAALGDAGAQNNLGILYENGQGVIRDEERAFGYYLLAAKQGNVYGQRNVAKCYKNGKGTKVDFTEAVSWLMTADAQHDAEACVTLARYYEEYSYKSDALAHLWRKRAATVYHDSESLFWMGEFHLRAGENRNIELAKEYFDQAASYGSPNMILRVAGNFCAVPWNETAPLSLERAKHWYQTAADCDDNDIRLKAAAGLDVSDGYGRGTKDGLDLNKAFFVYRQLASAGVKEAMVPCGYCYEIGKGTPGGISNLDLAIYWYEQAGSYTAKRVEWCKRQKSGYRETEYENRLSYELAPVTHMTHGKEFYKNDVNFTKFVYDDLVYYINGIFLCVSDQDGSNIRILAEFEKEYEYSYRYLAVNETGIYVYTQEEEAGLTAWVYNFSGQLIQQVKLPNPKSDLTDATFYYNHIYVHKYMLYYVLSEEGYDNSGTYTQKEKIYSLNVYTGMNSLLYQKATAIRALYANDEYIVFNAYYEDENDEDNWNDEGWMLYRLCDGQTSCLSCSRCSPENVFDRPEFYNSESSRYIRPEDRKEICIRYVDMERNLMWVERESYEGKDSAHLNRVLYWEARQLIDSLPCSVPLEMTPIWKVKDENRSLYEYFDGIHHYFGDSYYKFYASDKQGTCYSWGSSSHGVCDQVTVMGKWMFLDLEAYGEEQYALTLEESKPLRKTWFTDALSEEVLNKFRRSENDTDLIEWPAEESSEPPHKEGDSGWETNSFSLFDEEEPKVFDMPAWEDEEEESFETPSVKVPKVQEGEGLTLVQFRAMAKDISGHREQLLEFRKSLDDRWDYNAFVGILLSVKGPKHGDAACKNMAIGQGDNFKCAENKLIEKNLMELFMKYRGKRVDPAVTLQAVEDEIVAIAPELQKIREFFDKTVIRAL